MGSTSRLGSVFRLRSVSRVRSVSRLRPLSFLGSISRHRKCPSSWAVAAVGGVFLLPGLQHKEERLYQAGDQPKAGDRSQASDRSQTRDSTMPVTDPEQKTDPNGIGLPAGTRDSPPGIGDPWLPQLVLQPDIKKRARW